MLRVNFSASSPAIPYCSTAENSSSAEEVKSQAAHSQLADTPPARVRRHSAGAAMEGQLRRRMSNTDFMLAIESAHRYLECEFGMLNPYARLPNDAVLPPSLQSGVLMTCAAIDTVRNARIQVRQKPQNMDPKAWNRIKTKLKPNIEKAASSIRKVTAEIGSAVADHNKQVALIGASYKLLGMSAEEATATTRRAGKQLIENMDRYLEQLTESANSFSKFHAFEGRDKVLDTLTRGVVLALATKSQLSGYKDGPSQNFLADARYAMEEASELVRKEGPSERAKASAVKLQALLRDRMPEALPHVWADCKMRYDALLIPQAWYDIAAIDLSPEHRKNMLVRDIIDLNNLIAATRKQHDFQQITSRSDSRDLTKQSKEQMNIGVTDAISVMRPKGIGQKQRPWPVNFFDEFKETVSQRTSVQNGIVTIILDHYKKWNKLDAHKRSREGLTHLADKMSDFADGMSELQLYLADKMGAASHDEGLHRKAEVAFHELEYLEFVSRASAHIARAYAEFLPSVPEQPAPVTWSSDIARNRDVHNSEPPEEVHAENLSALLDDLNTQPEVVNTEPVAIKIATKPSVKATKVQQVRTALEVVQLVKPYITDAESRIAQAKEALEKHQRALTYWQESEALDQVIDAYTTAAHALDQAIHVLQQEGRDYLGSTSRTELAKQLQSCLAQVDFYTAYRNSPLSKPPTEQLIKDLQKSGGVHISRPVDRSTFIQLLKHDQGSIDNMFELVLTFAPFQHGKRELKVKPAYLHVHVTEDVKASDMPTLDAHQILAAHLKLPQHRKHGKAYTALTARVVERSPMEDKAYVAGLIRQS